MLKELQNLVHNCADGRLPRSHPGTGASRAGIWQATSRERATGGRGKERAKIQGTWGTWPWAIDRSTLTGTKASGRDQAPATKRLRGSDSAAFCACQVSRRMMRAVMQAGSLEGVRAVCHTLQLSAARRRPCSPRKASSA